jgi:hypothetical protein
MKVAFSFFCIVSIFFSFSTTALADYKIRQQVTMRFDGRDMAQERAIWVKGARERWETGFADPQIAAMMPVIAEVKQCDLRQTLKINDRSKKYFIVPFSDREDKPLPAVQPTTKTVVKKGGDVSWTYTLTDTGERRQMFGFTAKRLIVRQTVEATKDSCSGQAKMTNEEDGWFVKVTPEGAKCDVDLPRGEPSDEPKCRDRFTTKGNFINPGMLLEGTVRMTDHLKNSEMVTSIKTLDLSKATLEMSLFEIPSGYSEANSERSLLSIGNMMGDMSARANVNSNTAKTPGVKSVAVDFFSGSVSKINQPLVRQFVSDRITASKKGYGVLIMSQSDLTSGAFLNVVGVEIKSVKESGASKIGGLFGKVTGNDEAAKLGKSEAEVVVTLYGPDGKTVVATGSAKEKVDGKADDAVKAAIEKALPAILSAMK